MNSGQTNIRLPPIRSRISQSTDQLKGSRFSSTVLKKMHSRNKKFNRNQSPKAKQLIRQGFINKFRDKFAFGTNPSSKITSLLSVKTKDMNKGNDVYEKIDVLYFPTEPSSKMTSKSKPFISYNAIINSEEYFRETRNIVTPPQERERKKRFKEFREEDSDFRENSAEDSIIKMNSMSKRSIEKMNLRLEFNKLKRENYLKMMQNEATKSYRKAINDAKEWKMEKSMGTVKIMKRVPMASLESIRDKMLSKKLRKEKKQLEESMRSVDVILKKKKLKKKLKSFRGKNTFQIDDENSERESKLPSKEIREKHAGTLEMAYFDTKDIYVTKNFNSTEGIGYCYYKGKVYFFGGIGRPYDMKIYIFSPKTTVFTFNKFSNKISPSGRCFHSMAAKDNLIILFGGESSATGFGSRYLLNETWIFDLKLEVWEKISDSEFIDIEPRKNHSVCFMGRNMIVSGGVGFEDKVLDDFICFNMERKMWVEVLTKIDGFNGVFGHTMVSCFVRKPKELYGKPVKGNTSIGPKIAFEGIYVFGGKNQDRKPVNDLFIIDISVKPWKRVKIIPMGIPPRPRFGHCSHYLKETGCLLIYGGRNVDMYKVGNTTCFNDIFLLDLTYLTWNNVQIISGKSIERFNFCSYIHNQKLYFMGGMNDSNYLDYNPSVLEYNPDLAKKVRLNNRNARRRRRSLLKKAKNGQGKTEESEFELNFLPDQSENKKSKPMMRHKGSLEFGEESSESEEDLPLPEDRLKNMKIKNEKNFVSFLPLPDAFHKIVTMAEFIKRLGQRKIEEDNRKRKSKKFIRV